MGSGANNGGRPNGTLDELERRLVTMCNTVESLFAEAVVAFLEANPEMVKELRADDYRAHEQWLEIDNLATGLLTRGSSDPQQVRFIAATAKIAGALKRAADESLRVSESLRACQPDTVPRADSLPRMIELTQSMLSDTVEALLSRNATAASAVHLVFRELAGVASRAQVELGMSMQKGELSIPAGMTLACVAQRLERVGEEVVGIANQVAHLYRTAETG